MATGRKHLARAYLVLLALLSSVSDAPSESVDKTASEERGRGISLVGRRGTDKDFTVTTIRASGDTVFDNNGAAPGFIPEVPQIVINGSITAGDPTQAGRLTTGSISNCAGTNACPGQVNSLARHYDAYTFTNNSAAQACVTVQLNATGCAGQFMASASYLASFNPSSLLCTNFLGVNNSTFNGTQSYSFNVPGDATFIVVVYEANPDDSCASYTLTVSSDDISACPTTVFSANGSITAADPVQAGRNTTGVISNCTTTAVCPGPINTLPRHYDAYTFVNNGPTEECATIELIANACGGTFMAAAAYLNSFNPNNLCTNFLGMHNSTFNGTQSFAVRVPAGETMVVVVYEATSDTGCARYTLNVRSCGGLVSTTPRNGRIAFTSDRDGDNEIFVMDANGTNQTQLTFNTASDDQPAWSPNGTKIAFTSNRDGNTEIYVMNADGSNQTRLTNNTTTDSAPAWSPDGRTIAFHTNRDGNFEIYVMDQDGTDPHRLTTNAATELAPVWSADGTQIAFSSDRDGNTEIYIMNADGSGQTNLSNNATADQLPAFSPLGTKIAFQRLNGNNEIFVMDRDGTDQINLSNNVSVDGAPAWSPDGSKILFQSTRDGNQEVYVMNSDGTNQTRLTNNAANDVAADWQPAPLACLPAVIHGNIGQGSPDYPSTSGTQTGRISQNGVNSSCAAQKPTPGLAGGSFTYDAYQFANESNATACVTFAFPTSCGVNQAIHPVAYLGSYNPSSPAANYRGDFGSSINISNSGTFAVNVPAHTTVVLVVHEIGTVPDCPNYSFTVTGLPCPVKIVSIERPTNGHVLLQGLGIPNASHSVEFADDLGSGVFQSLDATVFADGLGLLRFEDASATGLNRRFYRFTYP